MRHAITLLILLLSSITFGQKFMFDYQKDYKKILEQTKDKKSTLQYDKLLNRFQNYDTTLTDFEVLALLIGYTANENFKPYNYLFTEREIYSLNGKDKYQEAISLCDSFLVHVPLSQQAIIEKSYAYRKLEQADSAEFYLWQFKRIMEAMRQSGDGYTPETAFFSLGPADGQNFLRIYASFGIGTMGSGRDKNGNFVDILEALWEDEETGERMNKKFYFQIQHASQTILDELNLGKKKDKKSKKKKKE